MNVILVIHVLVSIVLVIVVLLQRSEGGALGIGGGGGGGGLMSGRGAAGALVRATIIFGAIFFITSLVMTTISTRSSSDGRSDIERRLDEEYGGAGTPGEMPDILGDPSAPLLDDAPSSTSSSQPSPEAEEPALTAPSDLDDALDAEIPAEGAAEQDGQEAVDTPQP